MAATVRGLVLASHLGPTVVVTGLAAALSASAGAPPARVLLVTAAVLSGQLSIGWSNDWLDAARDLRVARADKPVVRGLVTAQQLRTAAVLAFGVCVVLSVATGALPGAVHIGVVAGGWAYNVRLKSTVWSWLPYASSFGLLAAFVVLALPGAPRPAGWAVAVGALLGVGAHLANVLPDLEDDQATGVRGLPHRLGRRWTAVLAPAVLAVAVVVAVAGSGPPTPGAAAVASAAVLLGTAGGVVGLVRPRSRLPFTLAMVVAVLCIGVLVAAGGTLVAG